MIRRSVGVWLPAAPTSPGPGGRPGASACLTEAIQGVEKRRFGSVEFARGCLRARFETTEDRGRLPARARLARLELGQNLAKDPGEPLRGRRRRLVLVQDAVRRGLERGGLRVGGVGDVRVHRPWDHRRPLTAHLRGQQRRSAPAAGATVRPPVASATSGRARVDAGRWLEGGRVPPSGTGRFPGRESRGDAWWRSRWDRCRCPWPGTRAWPLACRTTGRSSRPASHKPGSCASVPAPPPGRRPAALRTPDFASSVDTWSARFRPGRWQRAAPMETRLQTRTRRTRGCRVLWRQASAHRLLCTSVKLATAGPRRARTRPSRRRPLWGTHRAKVHWSMDRTGQDPEEGARSGSVAVRA